MNGCMHACGSVLLLFFFFSPRALDVDKYVIEVDGIIDELDWARWRDGWMDG